MLNKRLLSVSLALNALLLVFLVGFTIMYRYNIYYRLFPNRDLSIITGIIPELQSDLKARSESNRFDFSKGSLEEWNIWRDKQMDALDGLLGRMPERSKSTDVKVRGSVEMDGVVRERVVLSGEDGVSIPGYLFRPKTIEGKLPGVMIYIGHSSLGLKVFEGGYDDDYQHNAALRIAQAGYVTFVIENRGFGERGAEGGHAKYASLLLLGDSSYPAVLKFDGLLAFEYLASRPEVDQERMAVAGCSMGGVIAALVASGNEKVKGALLYSSFASSFEYYAVKAKGCVCFYLPRLFTVDPFVMYQGLAPGRLCIAQGETDFAGSVDESRTNFGYLQKSWEINGRGDDISLFIHPGGHEFVVGHAIGMLDGWFKK